MVFRKDLEIEIGFLMLSAFLLLLWLPLFYNFFGPSHMYFNKSCFYKEDNHQKKQPE